MVCEGVDIDFQASCGNFRSSSDGRCRKQSRRQNALCFTGQQPGPICRTPEISKSLGCSPPCFCPPGSRNPLWLPWPSEATAEFSGTRPGPDGTKSAFTGSCMPSPTFSAYDQIRRLKDQLEEEKRVPARRNGRPPGSEKPRGDSPVTFRNRSERLKWSRPRDSVLD